MISLRETVTVTFPGAGAVKRRITVHEYRETSVVTGALTLRVTLDRTGLGQEAVRP